MKNLKQMLLNHLETQNKEEKNRLSTLAGYSTSSNGFVKFLKEDKRDIKFFKGLVDIVSDLFPDREMELIEGYIRSSCPNNKSVRCGVEYAINNRLFSLADDLIEKLMGSTNPESKEWGNIYFIDRQMVKREISPYESLERIIGTRPSSCEMKAYRMITHLYAYYDNRMFELFFEGAKDLESMINNIEDEYIRKSYTCRYYLIMMSANMHMNNLKDARKYGELALNLSFQDSARSTVYLQIGNSYLYESYEKALENLKKADVCCHNIRGSGDRLLEIRRSINFVENYWSLEPSYLDFESRNPSDIHEVVFYYIRKNKLEHAESLLRTIDTEKLPAYSKGFHYFYKGLISKDIDDFAMSVVEFQKSGDRFYRDLSLIELKKLGVRDSILLGLGA